MDLSETYVISDDLELTEIRASDRFSIIKHINDEEISKNTLQIPFPYGEKDAEEFLNLCREFEDKFEHVGQFAIRYGGEMVGGIGFLYVYGETSHIAEIGYWLGSELRGNGIATLSIRKIIEIGFEVKGLLRIEANVFIDNYPSIKALERAGFEREGMRKARFIKNDQLLDAYLYAVIKSV